MGFQLVRAADTEIAVWNMEHGHVFMFAIDGRARKLVPGPFREAPDAALPATALTDEALAFATAEARSRGLLA